MKIHLVSGFLGSGKTTTIYQACVASAKQGISPAVITNDQGTLLVDSLFFGNQEFRVRQVGNGCYCCNYALLDESLKALMGSAAPDVIFAEAVGSCTDIVATVMKPLQRFYPDVSVTVSTLADARLLLLFVDGNRMVFNEDVRYIFFKQLEEGGVIVLTKTDLVTMEQVERMTRYLRNRFPGKAVICQSRFHNEGVLEWLLHINKPGKNDALASLDIDYKKYASGESLLAWLDKHVIIKSTSGRAEANAVTLIQKITDSTFAAGYAIGHMKYWLNDYIKISITAGDNHGMPQVKTRPAESAALVINARVQAEPENIVGIINAAIAETKLEQSCEIEEVFVAAFKPGYPKPTYRIPG